MNSTSIVATPTLLDGGHSNNVNTSAMATTPVTTLASVVQSIASTVVANTPAPHITNVTQSLLNSLAHSNDTVAATDPTTPHPLSISTVATNIANSTLSATTTTTASSSTLAHIVNETAHSIVTTAATLITNATTLLDPSSHPGNSTATNASTIPTITKSSSSASSLHPSTGAGNDDAHSGMVSGFIFQFLLIAIFFSTIIAAVYVIRKKHLDKLRHHLMPVYNFDPSEDGEDWETELLDDQFNPSSSTNSNTGPTHRSSQLKLDTGLTGGLKIHNNNLSNAKLTSSSGSHVSSLLPNASSGLLSSSDSHGSSGRRMYTTERDPIV